MSGGHWEYLADRLNEWADGAKDALALLAAIEHELDWGICADTCYECAKRRVIEALEAFFDGRAKGVERPLGILVDEERLAARMCDRCLYETGHGAWVKLRTTGEVEGAKAERRRRGLGPESPVTVREEALAEQLAAAIAELDEAKAIMRASHLDFRAWGWLQEHGCDPAPEPEDGG